MSNVLIKMKILVVIASFFCLLTSSLIANAVVNANKQYIEVAKNLITDFYKNKDLGMENNLSQYIGNQGLLNYLTDKYKTHQYVSEMNSVKIIHYTINLKLLEEKSKNSRYYLKFAVRGNYNYANSPAEDSGFCEEVEVLLKEVDGKYLAIDLYANMNYYDSAVRGEDIDIMKGLENYRSFDRNSDLQSDKIKEKQLQLKKRIDQSHKEQLKQTKHQEINHSIIGHLDRFGNQTGATNILSSTPSPLYMAGIANYARNNYYKNPPNSGNGIVNYYDFSQITNAYDCTNFVSHALLAGGATVYNTGESGISSIGWYYKNLNNRSSSWSGVSDLFHFLTTNTKRGPVGTYFDYYIFDIRNGQPYGKGDILQFHNGTVWRHSTIVTGLYTYSGNCGAKVTGRSGVNWFNDNQYAETVMPGQKRIIKISGNYN